MIKRNPNNGDGLGKIPIAHNEGGLIAALWRNILKDLNYTNKLPWLIEQYIRNTKPEGRKTKASITKNAHSGDMTFKTFMLLLFNVLSVKKITFSVKLTFDNGDETVHGIAALNDNSGTRNKLKKGIDAKRKRDKIRAAEKGVSGNT